MNWRFSEYQRKDIIRLVWMKVTAAQVERDFLMGIGNLFYPGKLPGRSFQEYVKTAGATEDEWRHLVRVLIWDFLNVAPVGWQKFLAANPDSLAGIAINFGSAFLITEGVEESLRNDTCFGKVVAIAHLQDLVPRDAIRQAKTASTSAQPPAGI